MTRLSEEKAMQIVKTLSGLTCDEWNLVKSTVEESFRYSKILDSEAARSMVYSMIAKKGKR